MSETRALRLIEDWKEVPEYERAHRANPLYCLSRRALVEKLLEKPSGPRVPGGILSNTYEWDLLAPAPKKTIFTEFFYKVNNSWGFDYFERVKRIVLSKLRALDPKLFEHLEQARIDRLLGTR